LQGANLSYAKLEGADLSNADLQGANLRLARLWHVHSTTWAPANFTLADLRGADFQTTPTDEERSNLRQWPEAGGFEFVASREKPVLVSASPEPALATHPDWLITEPTAAYTKALADYLASELASTDPTIATGIASNILFHNAGAIRPWEPVDVPVACRLLSETMAGRVRLQSPVDILFPRALKEAKQDCTPAAPAVSEAK
jgi:uncharacterized protein YjbI with pentapeptide repeats